MIPSNFFTFAQHLVLQHLRQVCHLFRPILNVSFFQRHPAITPPSFPQVQAPIVNNPLFWERLGPDSLFFAFYYQQVIRLYIILRIFSFYYDIVTPRA